MMAIAPHHLIHIRLKFVLRLLDIIKIGVVYCCIHAKGNAKAQSKDKAISSHTFLIY